MHETKELNLVTGCAAGASAPSEPDSDARAGPKVCKYTGFKSTDEDPLQPGSGIKIQWQHHDPSGEPVGRESQLSTRIRRKFYKNMKATDIFNRLPTDTKFKQIYEENMQHFIRELVKASIKFL